MVVDSTGVKDDVEVSYSTSNRSRDIRLPHFVTNDDDAGPMPIGQTPFGVLP